MKTIDEIREFFKADRFATEIGTKVAEVVFTGFNKN